MGGDKMTNDTMKRFQAKTPQQRFLHVLEEDFHYAPKVAEAILQEAQESLLSAGAALQPGQVRMILAKMKAGHGRALCDTATTEVTWTVDAGLEDRQVLQKSGSRVLRQIRIQRLLSEAIDQGAVATQEDFAKLQAQGIFLPSRGNLQGIGRGQTHKALIVGRWLQGETYDQIQLQTRHSISSVQRYVQTFVRVVHLHRQGFSERESALLLALGPALVREYLAVYAQHDSPPCRQRLAAQVQRLRGTSGPLPRLKKGGP
jgi:hypothetical protein